MTTCAPSSADSATRRDQIGLPRVHLHLHVAKLQESVAFYRAFFGEAPVKERPGYAKFLPSWAPVNLALSEEWLAPGGSISHLGIQLADAAAVRLHLDRVQAAGIAVRVEMNVDCCYANQDKFWVQDPAGLDWEVYVLNHDIESVEVKADAVVVPAAAPACCAPSCCKT